MVPASAIQLYTLDRAAILFSWHPYLITSPYYDKCVFVSLIDKMIATVLKGIVMVEKVRLIMQVADILLRRLNPVSFMKLWSLASEAVCQQIYLGLDHFTACVMFSVSTFCWIACTI